MSYKLMSSVGREFLAVSLNATIRFDMLARWATRGQLYNRPYFIASRAITAKFNFSIEYHYQRLQVLETPIKDIRCER